MTESTTPKPLHPDHAKLIADSSISAEVAAARGYYTEHSQAGLDRLGFARPQLRAPALVVPIFNVNGQLAGHQIRPDAPRSNKKGKPIKYESPSGSRLVLDVPRNVQPRLADATADLFITEGARKADSAASRGLTCISVQGVWGWLRRNDQGVSEPLADWDKINLEKRRIYLVFDSDVMTKRSVRLALSRLKTFLESRQATVFVVHLPPGDDETKVGLDDFFAAGHTADELLALASPDLPGACGQRGTSAPEYVETPEGIGIMREKNGEEFTTMLTNYSAKIVRQESLDDGAEAHRFYACEARIGEGERSCFTVSASEFASLSWVAKHLGAKAVTYPTMRDGDHVKTAIAVLSGEIPSAHAFAHTGWREVSPGTWAYLHARGAIGARGTLPDVAVRLSGNLTRFALPVPPTDPTEVVDSIRASLRLLDLAPDRITVPLFAAVWRIVLGPCDSSVFLVGATGQGKSELAALAQQHFGAGMHAKHLPGCWSSTGNALEHLAFAAKDALLVVDDFAPRGSPHDVARMHREADRLLRAQGNQAGRLRMTPDITLRPERWPRGLIVGTGEDVPSGASLAARMLVLEVERGDVSFAALTAAEGLGRRGVYAETLAAFVRWLAPTYGALLDGLRHEVEARRDEAIGYGHRRTAEIVANLALGLEKFAQFATEAGALDANAAQALRERGRIALTGAAGAQREYQDGADPCRRFFALLAGAIAAGRAHVATMNGGPPDDAGAWGWRQSDSGWRWQGDRVGYLDGDGGLYLQPEASYDCARKCATGQDGLVIALPTLKKRLREGGHLLGGTGARAGRILQRIQVEGRPRSDAGYLHLRARLILDPTRSAQRPERPDPP